MLENPVLQIVIVLAGLFLPFLGLVAINTEYFTSMFSWQGKPAQLASSVIGILLGGLIALAYFIPDTTPYVALFFFLDICWTGPSGGHDLISKFAERFGSK